MDAVCVRAPVHALYTLGMCLRAFEGQLGPLSELTRTKQFSNERIVWNL